MTFPSLTALTHTAGRLQSVALALVPHGGQRMARRNAWSAMSADAALARSRREVELAVADAAARTELRAIAVR